MQASAHALRAGPMQNQAIGRGEQHFKEHEEIEQVAGQEGAVQAHQEQLEQRMIMRADAVPTCQRKGQRSQRQRSGQSQHERR